MTLLSVIQEACLAMALPRPTTLSGAATPLAQTLVQLSAMGGKILARTHDWEALTITVDINPQPQMAQPGHPPAGFDRFPPQGKIWDVNRRQWLIGPVSSAKWSMLISDSQPGASFYWTRQRGNIQIWPVPSYSDLFRYSYVTRNWVRPEGGTGSTDTPAWVNGSDVALLSEDLLVLDLIWRFKQNKGLDYAEDMGTFEREKEKVMARDRGPSIVSTASDDYSFDDTDRPYTYPGMVIP